MGQPRIFEHAFQVDPSDIDRLGHVNNVVYLRYAQDAAVAHWNASVAHEARASLVWVVRRHVHRGACRVDRRVEVGGRTAFRSLVQRQRELVTGAGRRERPGLGRTDQR